MKIYFAADHGGFELKNALLAYARDVLHHDVVDCGAAAYDAGDDYPAIIAKAASALSADAASGADSRAVLAGASGQGEAIVANRFKGVRCAVYYGAAGKPQQDMSGKELDMLASTRVHNDANAISFGARFLSREEAKEALQKWLNTAFPGEERHARRIRQIDEIA